MNLSCYIVDDELHAIEVLKTFIAQTPGLELAGYHTDPKAAILEVTGPPSPRITFLDVDMPGLSGMEFAAIASAYTTIIFTTSYPEYALEAFEKDAADYLLKPIRYERFLRAIAKLQRYLDVPPVSAGKFYITSEIKGKMIRIVLEDIYYLESADNYVIIHFASTRQMAYLTMEEVLARLPKPLFVRVHRRFTVNTDKIKTVELNQLTLDNKVSVPMGRVYKWAIMNELNELLLRTKRGQ